VLALETTRLRAEQQEVIRELSRANDELRRGRAALEWAEQQHHQLMQLVLDEVELPGLVGALATALRASVTVEDADGRMLAQAPEQGYQPRLTWPPGGRVRCARTRTTGRWAGGTRWSGCRAAGRPGPRRWCWAASWPGGSGSPRRGRARADPAARRRAVALVVALLLLQSGTSLTSGADCPATCWATFCARAARSTPGPCWTGPRPSGTICPGRTWSRC